jgi:type VI secretion system protein ImpK
LKLVPQAAGSQYLTILEQFQAFYLEIIDLKREARSEHVLPAGTVEVLPPGGRVEEIWRKAAAILDRQSQHMIHAGPVAAGLHREARFVMAALADEVFVHPRWEGTDYWLSHLLETRLFHTHSAGEVFFVKLSSLLSRNDPADDQLAVVYLMALALGFRGKYAGAPEGDVALEAFRVRLYQLIRARHPDFLQESQHLFPDAYLCTVYEGVVRHLPAPGRWLMIAAAVVLFWLVTAWGVWKIVSHPVEEKLNQIEAKSGSLDTQGQKK